ncbi:MAG: hypothetical protein GF403_02045 [Candidatus Coatesbacteria bacterium]|nr:hypothetical protein [Candidatus Coatesbacteria bacterium]
MSKDRPTKRLSPPLRWLIRLGIIALLAGLFLLAGGLQDLQPHRGFERRVVVLGFDGVDSDLLERYMNEHPERFPNLIALRDEGTYTPVLPPVPAQSPVCWSSFTTGSNPGRHGIYDFLLRDPQSYTPFYSMVEEIAEAEFIWGLIPVQLPEVECRQQGIKFYDVLDEAGVHQALMQLPVTFPPPAISGENLSGLGVPDVRKTQGTFYYWAEDLPPGIQENTEFGGKLERLSLERDGSFTFNIAGTPNPVVLDRQRELLHDQQFRALSAEELDYLTRNPDIVLEATGRRLDDGRVTLNIDGQHLTLAENEWSDWVEFDFEANALITVHGISKLKVLSADPLRIYLHPITFDPRKPLVPISCPADLSEEVAEEAGLYYTQGWAIDTFSLSEDRIDEATFMENLWDTAGQRFENAKYLFEAKDPELMLAVFQCTDRVQHMMWRFIDHDHPMYDAELAAEFEDAILDVYAFMDEVVGWFRERLAPEDVLLVLSDHGFASFRRSVNINTWLVENGYMVLKEGYGFGEEFNLDDLFGGQGFFFPGVDWSKTRAYSLGLSGIYINLEGREAHGSVSPEDYDQVVADIQRDLRGLMDTNPPTGPRPTAQGDIVYDDYDPGDFTELDFAPPEPVPVLVDVYRGDEIYSGEALEFAPDLIVGFNDGYRISWQSCLGGLERHTLRDQVKRWSADHCGIDPSVVNAVLFCNQPLDLGAGQPRIIDLAPTIVDFLGVAAPEVWDGESLMRRGE